MAHILIHPTCTTSPEAIERVQRETGRIACIEGNRARLFPMPRRRGQEIPHTPPEWVPPSPSAA